MEQKKYSTLLLDPPFETCQRGRYGAVNHYPLMSVEEIARMPVGDLAADDAHCWLWVSNPTLRVGFDILEGWGFTPRSVFTWIKPHMGLGVYLRNATEHIILGTRGKAPVKFKSQVNWGFFPRQDHSHKPEEVYDIIERVSPGPYLELFARRPRHNWDAWGNEIPSDVEIPGYPVPAYSDKVRKSNKKGEA